MENDNAPMRPDEARQALADAGAGSAGLAASLRLPTSFHLSLGVAIAAQVGTAAVALTSGDVLDGGPLVGWRLAVLLAGIAAFAAVAIVQLRRFRALNGARVAGLASKAVLGTSTLSSVVYAAGLALAIWAGYASQWWLLAVLAVATGAAYADAGRRWWLGYRSAPAEHAGGETAIQLLALAAFAAAGVVLLVVNSR